MHYKYEYDITDEVRDLVVKNLLEMYERHKNDKVLFPERNKRLEEKLMQST